MRPRIFTALLLILLATGSVAAAEVINGIAAVVNDEMITMLEVNREYALALKEEEKRGGVLTPEGARKLREDVLNSLINRKLIRQKVQELNIVISEEEVRQSIEDVKRQNKLSQEALISALLSQGMTFDQYKLQLKEQLERLRLVSQEVKANISVDEDEIRAYYNSNPAQFSEDGGFRARAIFFVMPKDYSANDVRLVMDRIAAVMVGVMKNVDFAALARKYSDDPNAQNDGGDLGLLKKGEMLPEIEARLLIMKPGEVSEPVSSPNGFHILKLEEKLEAARKPYESVRPQIEELLYRKKSEERFNKWADELRKGAAVQVMP